MAGKRGSANVAAKLTERKVRAIRKKFAEGARIVDLKRKYEVSHMTIRRVVAREKWGWLE